MARPVNIKRAHPSELTRDLQEALDAVCLAKGDVALAAARMGMPRVEMVNRLSRAMNRMGTKTQFETLLEWDRFAYGREAA